MPDTLPQLPETDAPADDRIIGVAFRWSVVILLVLGVLTAAGVWYLKGRSPTGRVQLSRLSVPGTPESMEAEIPRAEFRDITADAGIQFVHNNGAYGEKLLPETMGGGVAFLDIDGDNDPDMLLINTT
jgi:enediyne biosynthesis protein E4